MCCVLWRIYDKTKFSSYVERDSQIACVLWLLHLAFVYYVKVAIRPDQQHFMSNVKHSNIVVPNLFLWASCLHLMPGVIDEFCFCS